MWARPGFIEEFFLSLLFPIFSCFSACPILLPHSPILLHPAAGSELTKHTGALYEGTYAFLPLYILVDVISSKLKAHVSENLEILRGTPKKAVRFFLNKRDCFSCGCPEDFLRNTSDGLLVFVIEIGLRRMLTRNDSWRALDWKLD